MAEAIDELLVRLGLDVDAKGFKEANNQFANMRSTALTTGAALGTAFLGMAKMSHDVAKSADELAKWSRAAGVSAQFAHKLGFAMRQVGGSDSDARTLIELANSWRDSAQWGELASRAFTAAGFNPQQIQQQNMSGPQTIDFVGRGLSAMPLDQRRQIANSLGAYDKAFRLLSDYAGMQNSFSRAGQLGGTPDDVLLANAEAYVTATTELGELIDGFKNTVAKEMLPGMTNLVEGITGWSIENRSEIEEAFKEAMPYLKATATGIGVLVAAQVGTKAIAMLAAAAATSGPAAAVLGLGAFYMDEDNRRDGFDSFTGGVDYYKRQWRRRLGIGSNEAPSPTAGPLALKSIFSSLIEQESGGLHYGADGKLLRSSAGALGITQLMPSTARNPGYGISPVANDSKEEYLRVGREYFYAMVKEFDGDTQKALAAYNAGAGTVKRAVDMVGANWMSAMPGETQAYVPSIMGRAGASGTTNYYSIDARGSADPAATEAAVRRVVDERIQNAAQISRDDFPNNVE